MNENEIYTLEETQKILKVSSSTMTRLIKKGIIRAAKVGKQYRILGKEILRMVSPKLEDRVGKIYNKGRRWLHEDDVVSEAKQKINDEK
ncbi:MAG: helix-turn-helix domain-containing protein [Candidatus Omnitrophica bacterium]|nr:helix-turn-helix domain-containing protein [Candidatus Omnitrophota bacterium]